MWARLLHKMRVQWGSVAPGALRGGAMPGQSAFPG
jgi:hypothetical protein